MVPFASTHYRDTVSIYGTVANPSAAGGTPKYSDTPSYTGPADVQIPSGVLQETSRTTAQEKIGSDVIGAIDFPVDPHIETADVLIVQTNRTPVRQYRSAGPSESQEEDDAGVGINWRVTVKRKV